MSGHIAIPYVHQQSSKGEVLFSAQEVNLHEEGTFEEHFQQFQAQIFNLKQFFFNL